MPIIRIPGAEPLIPRQEDQGGFPERRAREEVAKRERRAQEYMDIIQGARALAGTFADAKEQAKREKDEALRQESQRYREWETGAERKIQLGYDPSELSKSLHDQFKESERSDYFLDLGQNFLYKREKALVAESRAESARARQQMNLDTQSLEGSLAEAEGDHSRGMDISQMSFAGIPNSEEVFDILGESEGNLAQAIADRTQEAIDALDPDDPDYQDRVENLERESRRWLSLARDRLVKNRDAAVSDAAYMVLESTRANSPESLVESGFSAEYLSPYATATDLAASISDPETRFRLTNAISDRAFADLNQVVAQIGLSEDAGSVMGLADFVFSPVASGAMSEANISQLQDNYSQLLVKTILKGVPSSPGVVAPKDINTARQLVSRGAELLGVWEGVNPEGVGGPQHSLLKDAIAQAEDALNFSKNVESNASSFLSNGLIAGSIEAVAAGKERAAKAAYSAYLSSSASPQYREAMRGDPKAESLSGLTLEEFFATPRGGAIASLMAVVANPEGPAIPQAFNDLVQDLFVRASGPTSDPDALAAMHNLRIVELAAEKMGVDIGDSRWIARLTQTVQATAAADASLLENEVAGQASPELRRLYNQVPDELKPPFVSLIKEGELVLAVSLLNTDEASLDALSGRLQGLLSDQDFRTRYEKRFGANSSNQSGMSTTEKVTNVLIVLGETALDARYKQTLNAVKHGSKVTTEDLNQHLWESSVTRAGFPELAEFTYESGKPVWMQDWPDLTHRDGGYNWSRIHEPEYRKFVIQHQRSLEDGHPNKFRKTPTVQGMGFPQIKLESEAEGNVLKRMFVFHHRAQAEETEGTNTPHHYALKNRHGLELSGELDPASIAGAVSEIAPEAIATLMAIGTDPTAGSIEAIAGSVVSNLVTPQVQASHFAPGRLVLGSPESVNRFAPYIFSADFRVGGPLEGYADASKQVKEKIGGYQKVDGYDDRYYIYDREGNVISLPGSNQPYVLDVSEEYQNIAFGRVYRRPSEQIEDAIRRQILETGGRTQQVKDFVSNENTRNQYPIPRGMPVWDYLKNIEKVGGKELEIGGAHLPSMEDLSDLAASISGTPNRGDLLDAASLFDPAKLSSAISAMGSSGTRIGMPAATKEELKQVRAALTLALLWHEEIHPNRRRDEIREQLKDKNISPASAAAMRRSFVRTANGSRDVIRDVMLPSIDAGLDYFTLMELAAPSVVQDPSIGRKFIGMDERDASFSWRNLRLLSDYLRYQREVHGEKAPWYIDSKETMRGLNSVMTSDLLFDRWRRQDQEKSQDRNNQRFFRLRDLEIEKDRP
jgi:hypothetical protein